MSFFADKTIKLWKVSERDKRAEGYNLKEDSGLLKDPSSINTLRVPVLRPMELMVEASPRLAHYLRICFYSLVLVCHEERFSRGNTYL